MTNNSGETPPTVVATDYRSLRLRHDAWGGLVLMLADGTEHTGIEPIRSFPWTAPGHAISLMSSEGHELLLIPSLDLLTSEARTILERDLAAREFVPVIQRIVRSSGPWPPCHWDVETDRGAARVSIDSEDEVRQIGGQSALVTDSSGVRYLIPDTRTLDATSLKHLRRLL